MSSEPFLGSIKIFGFNYAPRGYAFCNGQLLGVPQNTALFSLLGTTYGGNGQSNFGLPDLRSRAPIHFGQSAGNSNYTLGQTGGTENVTLTTQQMPSHNHNFVNGTSSLTGSTTKATLQTPTDGAMLGRGADSTGSVAPLIYVPAGSTDPTAALGGVNVAGTITPNGGNQAHTNMQPFLVLNFCIATSGLFPSRN